MLSDGDVLSEGLSLYEMNAVFFWLPHDSLDRSAWSILQIDTACSLSEEGVTSARRWAWHLILNWLELSILIASLRLHQDFHKENRNRGKQEEKVHC